LPLRPVSKQEEDLQLLDGVDVRHEEALDPLWERGASHVPRPIVSKLFIKRDLSDELRLEGYERVSGGG
jgi:hypothetical protein